jgi:archaellum component FlaC
MVTSLCYNGVAKGNSPIPISVWDMHPTNTTNLSLRSYSGGVTILNCNNTEDNAIIELIAGRVVLQSTCTSGYIEIRGVGYLTDYSSGTTIKTNGLVSQTLTSEDVAKLTGITSAIDGMTIAVESLDEKVSYISGTTYEMNENVIIMTSGFTDIEISINDMSIAISGMTESVNSLDEKVSYISGTTYEMNENVLIMTSGFTDIEVAISGMTDSINDMSVQVAGLDEQVKRILGLSQENFRILDHVYVGDNLSSATIKIYNNSIDCTNDVSPLSTYSMVALYDAGGKLIDYKVTKN